MTKKEIRRLYLKKRKELSSSQFHDLQTKLIRNVIENFDLENKTVHVFLPIERQNEINTNALMSAFKMTSKNVQWVVSKCIFSDLSLQHFLLNENTEIEVNNYGIPEPISGTQISPSELDLVFVPLLAADKSGNRVGYGAGYYDRFLSECSNKCKFVGLCLFEPIEQIDGLHENDIPLHFLASPQEILKIEQK